MIFKNNKQNLYQILTTHKTGYKKIFDNWLIVIFTSIILNIAIIILAIYFWTIINNQEITIPRPETLGNFEMIDKNLLEKIINHFDEQVKISDNWVKASHLLIDPSL
ncbi:MAG: hypothetical protein WAV11_03360 [Minisyncoccia bacterium]